MTAVAEDVVVLDVQADHYFCIPGAAEAVRPRADGSLDAEAEAADLLLDSGLAQRLACPARRAAPTPRARVTAAGRPGPLALAAATLQLIEATQVFRRSSLSTMAQPTAPRPETPASIVDCLGLYEAVLPWIPGEGECLQRAFLLRRLLARRGIAVDWVFGVRTWPFGAHCWIQAGDRVVGDTLDRVGRYTPILTVG
jgi:hypothetical protein